MALAGLLVVLHAGMDMKATLAGKHPWLLYALAPAMRPRMLLTLDEGGQLLSCPVRVGQAVDVVAQVRLPAFVWLCALRRGQHRGLQCGVVHKWFIAAACGRAQVATVFAPSKAGGRAGSPLQLGMVLS